MFVVAGSPYNDSSTHVTVAPSFVQQNITITMGTCIPPDGELTLELFLPSLRTALNSFERENRERGIVPLIASPVRPWTTLLFKYDHIPQ